MLCGLHRKSKDNSFEKPHCTYCQLLATISKRHNMKIWTTFLIFLFLINFVLSCKFDQEYQGKIKIDFNLEKRLEDLTDKVINDSIKITFQFDTLTTYSWDTLIIITPYCPIVKIEKDNKLDLRALKNTMIISDEVTNVLAFIKKGVLFSYVDLPRDKGDFANTINNYQIFNKNNCIFEMEQTDIKFESGRTLVKVKPIK